MRLLFLLISILIFTSKAITAPPSSLTTDLLEHTDRIFLDGYLSTMTLSETGTAIERYQVAQVRSKHPYLGWIMNSETPNTLQTAYRIEVASSKEKLLNNEPDIWDSGKVKSNNSIAVKYEGEPLLPSTTYYWRVKTWDNHGGESPFSTPKAFMTAKELDNLTARYPLQITDESPTMISSPMESITFLDFGKAAFGKLKVTLASESGKDTVTIHLGEHAINDRVDRDPGLPQSSIRYTKYELPLMEGIHTYTIKFRPDKRNTARKANESGVDPIFMPEYIGEVYPFRYCEIENYSHPLTITDATRQSVHYPFNDWAAYFHSSDTILNQVWDISKYSIKATSFLGVYVDGDRERIPYEADAIINQLSHYYTDREFSMARYTHEHLVYNPTWPTEWHLQSVLIAWYDYLFTGNKASLERCYNDLKAKTFMGLKEKNGLISTQTGKLIPEFYQTIHFKGKEIRDIVDWPAGEQDGFEKTAYNSVVNAYHYEAVKLMSRIAEVLGHQDDHRFYTNEAEKVKKQFNRLLFNSREGYYQDGIDTKHGSLHANMFPMAFEMVPEKNIAKVADFIRSRGMACSVYGSQFLLDAVYKAHDAEHGLQLLTSTGSRGWYNMIRAGSTITMEAWDDKYKPNQDWNHAWGAAPANLIPAKLMGIEPLEPGFGRIRVKPQPASLREASVRVPTIRGPIDMSFVNNPGKDFTMEIEIPANSTAEIYLPLVGPKYTLLVNNLEQQGTVSGQFVKVNTGSGKHTFTITKK